MGEILSRNGIRREGERKQLATVERITDREEGKRGSIYLKARVSCSLITTTVQEQHPRLLHKGVAKRTIATGSKVGFELETDCIQSNVFANLARHPFNLYCFLPQVLVEQHTPPAPPPPQFAG